MVAERLGRDAMVSSVLLLRLMSLLSVEAKDGVSGLLFTAPHGIWVRMLTYADVCRRMLTSAEILRRMQVRRPGHADHKPEVVCVCVCVCVC